MGKKAKTSSKTSKTSKIRKSDVYYTIFVLAWALLSLMASQFVIAQPMVWILGEKVSQPGWMLLYYLLSYAVALALIIFIPPRLVTLYAKQHKQTATEASRQLTTDLSTTASNIGLQKPPTFIDLGLAPIGYIVYLFFANIVIGIFSHFSWFNANQAQDVGFSYFNNNFEQTLGMLAVVFIAPIAEEIIMRGWLYGKIRTRIKNIPLAIILVSTLFAFLHGQLNVGITTFVLSVVLCTLREITGTIWSGMLLHILSNGIAFYMLYIAM